MDKVLVFDESTGELLAIEPAIPNPREPGKYLLPPNSIRCSESDIPEIGPNQTIIRNGESVSIVADFRGTHWFSKFTGSRIEFSLGDAPDSTMVQSAPGEFEQAPWDNEAGFWGTNQAAIDIAKRELTEQLESIRLAKEQSYRSTIEAHGTIWDSGERYLRNLERAIRLYAIQPVEFWLDAENEAQPVQSVDFLVEIRDKIDADTFMAGQALYSAKWQKRAEILQAAPSKIRTIDLFKGWPW